MAAVDTAAHEVGEGDVQEEGDGADWSVAEAAAVDTAAHEVGEGDVQEEGDGADWSTGAAKKRAEAMFAAWEASQPDEQVRCGVLLDAVVSLPSHPRSTTIPEGAGGFGLAFSLDHLLSSTTSRLARCEQCPVKIEKGS